MHELSIALNILDIVQDACHREGAGKTIRVVLEIGTLSGVDTAALTACLHIASRETIMKDAEIRIERHQGRGLCGKCRQDFVMDDLLVLCPVCNLPAIELKEGQEMRIIEIVADK